MDRYLLTKLKKWYPDCRIVNLYKNHPSAYGHIRAAAARNNMTISAYLESHGFMYVIRKAPSEKKEFDFQTATLLINEYGFSGVDLAKLLGVTRAEVSRKILNGVKNVHWVGTSLGTGEVALIKKMISKSLFELEQDGLYVRIANNGKNICIFIKNKNLIKVVFDIHKALEAELRAFNFHILDATDIEIKNSIKTVKIMGKDMAVYTHPSISTKIGNRSKKLGLTRTEYLKLLGCQTLCRNSKDTDEMIIATLKKYADSNNHIYFPNRGPNKPPEYHAIANRASRENMTLDEFFNFFGFTKEKGRHKTSYNKKMLQYKKELADLCIPATNHIYLKPGTHMYKKLYSFSRLRNKTLDAMLADIGYQRIYHKKKNDQIPLLPNEQHN